MNKPQRFATRWRWGLVPAACLLLATVGCNLLRWNVGPDRPDKAAAVVATPGDKYTFRVPPQFLFHADFEVNRNLPIFQDLAGLREQVLKDLQLPGSATMIQVRLFEDEPGYEQFMKAKYPNLPKRRAFFVAQPRMGGEDLLVYTYWGTGERIQQDLRHELTHALLNSVIKKVPLWLDEGLAEYFEMPYTWKGVNYQHLARLRVEQAQGWKPNLERLEGLSEVQQMTPAEYREAWGWVHLMLHGSAESRKVLVGYLRELRTKDAPGKLGPRLQALYPNPEPALLQHLARLDAAKGPADVAQKK